MAKDDSDPHKKEKKAKNENLRWLLTIFPVTILVSGTISFVSDALMEASGIFVAFTVLFFIVFLGIVFDVIGVAVTSAEEKPFHSMAAKKVPAAAECIRLLRKADRVSSICNDVVGDICGVVSGAAAANISVQLVSRLGFSGQTLVGLVMSALVAGFTVGGKAACKGFAMESSTKVVLTVGRVLYGIKHLPQLLRGSKKKAPKGKKQPQRKV